MLGKGKVRTVRWGGGGKRKEKCCAVATYRKGQLAEVVEVVSVWLNLSQRVL